MSLSCLNSSNAFLPLLTVKLKLFTLVYKAIIWFVGFFFFIRLHFLLLSLLFYSQVFLCFFENAIPFLSPGIQTCHCSSLDLLLLKVLNGLLLFKWFFPPLLRDGFLWLPLHSHLQPFRLRSCLQHSVAVIHSTHLNLNLYYIFNIFSSLYFFHPKTISFVRSGIFSSSLLHPQCIQTVLDIQ